MGPSLAADDGDGGLTDGEIVGRQLKRKILIKLICTAFKT